MVRRRMPVTGKNNGNAHGRSARNRTEPTDRTQPEGQLKCRPSQRWTHALQSNGRVNVRVGSLAPFSCPVVPASPPAPRATRSAVPGAPSVRRPAQTKLRRAGCATRLRSLRELRTGLSPPKRGARRRKRRPPFGAKLMRVGKSCPRLRGDRICPSYERWRRWIRCVRTAARAAGPWLTVLAACTPCTPCTPWPAGAAA